MKNMAETKQISATIDLDLANWIVGQADKDKRSYSQMVEILLLEAKGKRDKLISKKGDDSWKNKYIK